MSETTALIIGNGGREHAMAIELAGAVDTLYFTGSNAGIEGISNAQSIGSVEGAVDFVRETSNGVKLVAFGPEQPLVDGMSNQMRESGLVVFGPSQESSQFESSKYFAREFMKRHGIASPSYTLLKDWNTYQNHRPHFKNIDELVFKADGLAGGKGVILPESWEEADRELEAFFAGAMSNAAENGVLVEERLHGPEVSMFVLTDGTNFSVLPLTQDHKRRDDGDKGKNTGGTGAYTIPENTIVSDQQMKKLHEIARQSVEGMAAEGMPYKGVLYIGAMLAEERDGDPVVIEYNVRFGDPEAQVLLPLLGENTFDVLASTDSKLREDLLTPAKLAGQAALTVCLMADAYPDGKSIGEPIYGLENAYEGVTVHHGGTKLVEGGNVVTNGGRILYITGSGETVDEAAANAYRAIDPEGFEGGIFFNRMHYRTDIAWQVRKRAA